MSSDLVDDLNKLIDIGNKIISETEEYAKLNGRIEGRIQGMTEGRVKGQAEAKDEILKLFSELSDAGLDKDQILEELSRRFNAGK